MVATCVHIKIKADRVDEFIAISGANHNESVKEPGNLRFDFLRMEEDPCGFMLYEAYETPEAAAAHKETAHYAKWREAVADMMAEPRYGVKYDILKPSQL